MIPTVAANKFIYIIVSLYLVNPGMEHSDSDSFPENIRHGFTNRVPADPSRSNSLMSETSSQPDIHPFFKVSKTQKMWKNSKNN